MGVFFSCMLLSTKEMNHAYALKTEQGKYLVTNNQKLFINFESRKSKVESRKSKVESRK